MTRSIDVVMVDSCLRDGVGGSPTAVVLDDGGLDRETLMRIPGLTAASHVAAVRPPASPGTACEVRFFTSEAELPACGHGTVAVIAVLAVNARQPTFDAALSAGGRTFDASGLLDPRTGCVEGWFGQGRVDVSEPPAGMADSFRTALGLIDRDLHRVDMPAVASPGRPRLLLPVANRRILESIVPNAGLLASESHRHGQLGCFVYVPATAVERACARMFAPAIGVSEDVANANSTGCLAAHMVTTGRGSRVVVDQGDALGRPSTVLATAMRSGPGIDTRVGGVARIAGTVRVTGT